MRAEVKAQRAELELLDDIVRYVCDPLGYIKYVMPWGEGPTTGAPPAVVNAVVDALSHLGVRHVDMPLTAEKIWQVLQNKS